MPSDCQTPIAATLQLANEHDAAIAVELDFLELGEHHFNIDIETDDGHLQLSKGGSVLPINGETTFEHAWCRVSRISIAQRRIDADLTPFTLVTDAFLRGPRLARCTLY